MGAPGDAQVKTCILFRERRKSCARCYIKYHRSTSPTRTMGAGKGMDFSVHFSHPCPAQSHTAGLICRARNRTQPLHVFLHNKILFPLPNLPGAEYKHIRLTYLARPQPSSLLIQIFHPSLPQRRQEKRT